jgi:hypothetical protein
MELLGDLGCVGVGARGVHGMRQTYHRLGKEFGRT